MWVKITKPVVMQIKSENLENAISLYDKTIGIKECGYPELEVIDEAVAVAFISYRLGQNDVRFIESNSLDLLHKIIDRTKKKNVIVLCYLSQYEGVEL